MKYYPHPAEGLDLKQVNAAIEEAFAEHGRGRVQMPAKLYTYFEHGDFRTMPGYIPSMGMAGVKIVNVHPDNRAVNLPTVMALTVIIDIDTGIPVAILNATKLTDLRTAAAGAVAAKYLSPKRSITLGCIGSGRQAQSQVRAIAQELEITELLVWSRDEKNAKDFCEMNSDMDCRVSTIERASGCDVVVTATPSRKPLVMNEWISDGTHINAIGADAPGKEELEPAILKRASVIVDDPAQAIHSGEINVPIANGQYDEKMIAGTLGEYVIGMKSRKSPEEITVFDSTGLAIQDLAIAKIAISGKDSIELPFP